MKSLNAIAFLVLFLFWACNPAREAKSDFVSQLTLQLDYSKIDTTGPVNPWAKFSGDLDQDGINDIIIGGQKGPLVWYRYPAWRKYNIAGGGYNTVDGEVGDIDADGDLDVVMGGLVWFENPGNLSESPEQTWTIHRIADHPTHDIEIADLNNDDRLDIIFRDQSEFNAKAGNSIHLWLNNGQEQWEEIVLDCPHGEGIEATDLDGDADPDIIIGGIWFENDFEDGKTKWIKHTFADWHPNANVKVADLNADNRKDIVLVPSELRGSYYKIAWFEAPENLDIDQWIEHTLQDTVECVVHSLAVGDLDNNGFVDIGYAEMHQGEDPDEVVVLLNRNRGQAWEKQVISDKGSHGLRIDDLNNDGLLDVFGANWSSDYQPIEVWINKGTRKITDE